MLASGSAAMRRRCGAPPLNGDVMRQSRSSLPAQEVYCDLNARMTEHGYSLERHGSVVDLEKYGLTLEAAIGRSFIFYMDDGDDAGNPDDIMFLGTVTLDTQYGYLAARDERIPFFHRSELVD